MRFLLRFLFAFHLSLIILQSAHAQPLPERVPLIGKITTTSGLPIGGAAVAVSRQDIEVVGEAAFWGGKLLTGADGIFSFLEAEEGVYSLAVNAEGYENFADTLEWRPRAPLFIAKLLKLTPQPLRLVKPDGKPAAGAKAYLYLRGQPPGHVSFHVLQADDDGKIAVPPITPAQYWFHAIVPGVGYSILPNLSVKENQSQLVEVKLQAGGRVRAVVKTADGKAIGGVALSLKELLPAAAAQAEGGLAEGNNGELYLQTQPRSSLVTADGSGEMELSDVAPGRYQARLYMPGEANPVAQTIEVKAGQTADVSGVYTLQSSKAALQLTVQGPDNKPAADREFIVRLQPLRNGSPVPLTQDGPPVPPDVAPTIANLFQGVLTRHVKTNSDGKATLFPLRSGEWQVSILEEDQAVATKPRGPIAKVTIGEQGAELTMKLLPPNLSIAVPTP